MNKCSISIQTFAEFTKQLLAQDPKYKDFAEVAKFIIKRPGQPEAVKMVALKGLGKIYSELAKKDSTFSFTPDDSKVIDVDLENDDLEGQFKKLAAEYSIRPAATINQGSIKSRIEKVLTMAPLNVQDEVLSIIKDIKALAKTNFRKSVDDITKTISSMFDSLTNAVLGNQGLTSTIKTGIRQLIEQEKNKATNQNSDYVPIKNTIYGDSKLIVRKDGSVVEVLQGDGGKFYDVNSDKLEQEIPFDRSNGDQLFNLRVDSSPFVAGNDGTQYIFSNAELSSGMNLYDRTGGTIVRQLLAMDNPMSGLQVVASRSEINRNLARLNRIRQEIPGRSLETHEVASQQKALLSGKPVITVFSPVEGAQIQFTVPGQQGAMVLYGVDNYAIVYPDNRTERVTFSDEQKSLILKLGRKSTLNDNGLHVEESITEEDFQKMKAYYNQMTQFKKAVQELLDKNPDQENVVIPQSLVAQYITLARGRERFATAPSSDKRASLSTLLEKSGAPGQVSIEVVTANEDGYGNRRSLNKPIIVAKEGGIWSVVSDLSGDDRVVVNRDGKEEYVTFAEYVKDVLKINPEVTSADFPTSFAWLYVKPDGQVKPVALTFNYVENPAEIAQMAMSFGELIKSLNDPQVEAGKVITEFNKNIFGFNPHSPKGGTPFFADFSHFKDPTGDRSLNIQLRPGNISRWMDLPADVRKALTVYIDVPIMNKFIGVMRKAANSKEFKELNKDINTSAGKNALMTFVTSDPQLRKELMDAYDEMNKHIYKKFDQIREKLAKSSYNGQFDMPQVYAIMENEKASKDGKWKLKIRNRQQQKNATNLSAFQTLTTEEIFKYTSVEPRFAGPIVSAVQTVTEPVPAPNPTTNTTAENVPGTATDINIDLDFEEGAFELALDTELVERYQEGQFQQELDWIQKNLPATISVEDLADIMSDLKAEGRVLGYFRDRVIYLNKELSGRGSGYHEAFHGVFRHLLDAPTRQRILDLTLAKMGPISKEQVSQFRQMRSLYHLSNAQIKERMAEEYLADRFKTYKLEGRGAQEGWLKKILNLLKDIVDFFTGKSNEIDRLFRRIDNGFYKNAEIIGQFKEGAFEMLPTRSTLVTGPNSSVVQRKNFLSKVEQAQLVNRMAELASFATGTFTEKFNAAKAELLKELNINNLIAQNPDKEQAIRAKYEQPLLDKLYILGEAVNYYNETGDVRVDNNLAIMQATPKAAATYNEQQQQATKSLFDQVQKKLDRISIANMYFDPEAAFAENDEEFDEDDYGDRTDFEDSFVNMNTLDGLSKQFRSFFGLLSYVHTDELGIKTTKMVDGAAMFDTMMKILADTPVEKMMIRMEETIEKMKLNDNQAAYNRLNTVWEKMSNIFGLNEDLQPTRNLNLYNQFIDAFNVVDLSTDVFYINTKGSSSELKVVEATMQNDINQYYEKLRRKYENGFMKKSADEKKEALRSAKAVFKQEITSATEIGTTNWQELLKKSKNVHKALKSIGIELPLDAVTYSLIAIDVKENNVELSPKSKAYKQFYLDQDLINSGAYLEKDFFDKLIRYADENTNIFDRSVDDLTDGTAGLSDTEKNQRRLQKRSLGLINSVLRKTGHYVVKYDMDTVVSVFRNAEGKNVYRYVRYTPPLLISQSLKENGWMDTYADFPVVQRFLADNPLTAKSPELQLYLQNLDLRIFGGARQTLKGNERDGVTAKTIDTAGYYLSYVLMSMNRKTVSNGKATVTTFSRMLTQNEASNTIYMVPNLYKRMVTSAGYLKEDGENMVVSGFMDIIRQEYNRIQREWESRDEKNKELYVNYNVRKNPDGSRNVEDPALRAYNFNLLADFFEFDQNPGTAKNQARAEMRDQLIAAAKSGAKFDKLNLDSVKTELLKYAEEKFAAHMDNLKRLGVVSQNPETSEYSSQLIPGSYTIDKTTSVSIDSEDSNLESYLKDVFFNVFLNNLQVSQFFDGDIALGVKNFADYFKRQKMNVAAGPSMKSGNHTVAYVDELSVLINDKDLEEGQYDENDEMPDNFKDRANKIKVFDGQSVTTIEHRIEQYRKQGRLDEDPAVSETVEQLLKASRYRRLTEDEVKYLRNNKVVLGPKKTVTGALIYYHKQAEHILMRMDSSYMVVPEGMTRTEVEKRLADLYNQADLLRAELRNAVTHTVDTRGIDYVQDQLSDVYQEIHQYWEPLPNRAAHHYMLNSMERADVDQLMDLTASKKATLLPVTLSNNGLTDLKQSRLVVPNKYKFDQVETSKVATDISSTTQLMHLIDADFNMADPNLDTDLKDAILQYRKMIGQLAEVSLNRLNNIIKNEAGEVEVRSIIRKMRDGLEAQGADSNTLKFFEIRDDQPIHNVNLPLIKRMFTFYYFSFYSDGVFSKRQSGRKDYLITSWGYKLVEDRETGEIIKSEEVAKNPEKYNDNSKYKLRYPGIKYDKENNRYIVEVIVPRPYFKNQEEIDLFERKLSLWLSTRIPTEDKRSMMVAKVVDFIDGAYQNAIVVPQLIHILSGSDLDIDSLYSHTFATYEDFNGKTKVYGEANTPKEQFVEYIQSMMEDESLEPLIKAELDKIYKEDIIEIPESLEELAEELNLPWHQFTKEQLVSFIKEQKEIRNQAYESLKAKKEKKEQVKEIYVKLRAENDALAKQIEDRFREESKDWGLSPEEFQELLWERTAELAPKFKEQGKKSSEYRKAKKAVDSGYVEIQTASGRIQKSREEIDRINRMFKVLATMNVLASKKMPITARQYASAVSKKGSLVTETLQNDMLQAKIDILGNPYTFKNLYVQERSSVDKFEKIAKSMNKGIKDVINRNNIFSPDGIINSRDMVTSSNDGIGIAANVNKFAAFASKKGLKLSSPIWIVNDKSYDNFQADKETRPIQDIGNALGMQADAKSNPIPAVLNLNEVSLPITLLMLAQKLPLEMAVTINSVPLISKVIQRVLEEKREIRTTSDLYNKRSFRKIADEEMYEAIDELKKDGVHTSLFETDDEENIIYKRGGSPLLKDNINLEFKYDYTPADRVTASDLGFTLTDSKGIPLSDKATQVYLLIKYLETQKLNNDVYAVGSILNLYKKLKPSWKAVDRVLGNYAYLTGVMANEKSMFANIQEVLESSVEFRPLIKALKEMTENAEVILIERNPVVQAVNDTIKNSLQAFKLDEMTQERLTDQIVKYFIINKFRGETEKRLQEEQAKEQPNQNTIKSLNTALEMFKADFWKGEPSNETVTSMEQDFQYLKDTQEGNPFVDYLKERTRNGITYLEALSRMKLDKEYGENVNDGFTLLEKSPDTRTALIARKLFHYLLIKDGLGYGTNTFISYLNPQNPETFEKISGYLNELQAGFNAFNKANRKQIANGKADGYYKNFNKLLNSFFGKNADLNVYISSMINRIGLYAGNNDVMVKSRPIFKKNKKGPFAGVDLDVIKEEMKDLLPDTHNIEPKAVYTELEDNPDNTDLWLPNSKEVDTGKLTVDTTKLASSVGSKILTQMNILPGQIFSDGGESITKYTFPLFVKNTFGTVLRLTQVDDQRVSDKIINNLTSKLKGKDYVNTVQGLKAVYTVTEQEGTDQVLNLGFDEAESRELYKFTQNDTENQFLDVSLTPELEDRLQRLKNNFGVDSKRLNLLARIIRYEVLSKGAILFDKQKNNTFFLNYTIDTKDRGPVERKIYIRPSEKDPLSVTVKIYEREIVSGNETLVKLPDELKEFKAVDVEFVKRGKGIGWMKKQKVENPVTQEMVNEVVKNYRMPEGMRLKNRFQTFEWFAKIKFEDHKETLNLKLMEEIYNKAYLEPIPAAEPEPEIEPGRFVTFNKMTYIVTKINDNGTVQIYDPTKEGVESKKSVASRNLIPTKNKAKIINYKGTDYLVTPRETIISLVSNKAMMWTAENGDRKAILALAKGTGTSNQTQNKEELIIPAGYMLRPGAPTLSAYLSMMKMVSDKSVADLTEMYKNINLVPIVKGNIEDVRKDLDSGECIAEL